MAVADQIEPPVPDLSELNLGPAAPGVRVAEGLRAVRGSSTLFPGWVGVVALVALLAATVAYVLFAAAGLKGLVPTVHGLLPAWEAGPLRDLLSVAALPRFVARRGMSVVMIGALVAYGCTLAAAGAIPRRVVLGFAVAVNLILLLAPPAQLNDVFNYLGYARLLSAHGLNPYVSVIGSEHRDIVYRLTSWHNLSSPYGPLFTAGTALVALLPLSAAYWVLKVVLIAASVGLVFALDWVCRLQERDSRLPLLLLVANPVYLLYAVAGFHNDFLMLLPAVLAVGLVVGGQERSGWDQGAGALAVVAAAVKPTMILLLPFLVVAAATPGRRKRVLVGAGLAALPIAACSLALFGTAVPNVAQQSRLVTGFSFSNLIGLALGFGGVTPLLLKVADLGVVLVVLWGMRRRDWIAAFGWATVAIVVGLGWLMPWYVIWALPLAGLGLSRGLRVTAVVMTAFVLITFLPITGTWLQSSGIDPMATAIGLRHIAYERFLQYGRHCQSVRIRGDGQVVCAQRRQQRGAQRLGRDLVSDRRADARADRT